MELLSSFAIVAIENLNRLRQYRMKKFRCVESTAPIAESNNHEIALSFDVRNVVLCPHGHFCVDTRDALQFHQEQSSRNRLVAGLGGGSSSLGLAAFSSGS